jgi:hypothetical protein
VNRAVLLASLVVALAGCNQGHDELSVADLSVAADLGGADLSAPDLKGPTCGQMAVCILACGVTDFQCDQGCVAGAMPAAIQEAGALTLCAAQNCLSGLLGGDGGMGGTFAVLQCLKDKCPMQVDACEGLPFSGTN